MRKELLEDHQPLCKQHCPQKIKFPEDLTVKFNNVQKQLEVPFIVYADLECYTEKIQGCDPNPNSSSSTPYQHHTPSGFGYKVVSEVDAYTKDCVVYRGNNVIETLLDQLLQEDSIFITF